jgi:hypothetical protein
MAAVSGFPVRSDVMEANIILLLSTAELVMLQVKLCGILWKAFMKQELT